MSLPSFRRFRAWGPTSTLGRSIPLAVIWFPGCGCSWQNGKVWERTSPQISVWFDIFGNVYSSGKVRQVNPNSIQLFHRRRHLYFILRLGAVLEGTLKSNLEIRETALFPPTTPLQLRCLCHFRSCDTILERITYQHDIFQRISHDLKCSNKAKGLLNDFSVQVGY